MALEIVEPPDGFAATSFRVNISGALSDPVNTGAVVNGVVADVILVEVRSRAGDGLGDAKWYMWSPLLAARLGPCAVLVARHHALRPELRRPR